MPERPQATVRLVEESEATGRVAAIFADIRATKGIDAVPNFWRALATNADHLELIWSRLKAIMHPEAEGRAGRLDPLTREIIALAVSATNGCPTASTRCADSLIFASLSKKGSLSDVETWVTWLTG